MARIPTTHDSFNAIAEPKRRAILQALLDRDMTVSELVCESGWNQPTVSKHLGVLKQVGLVVERRQGRHRIYRLNVEALHPVRDWLEQFADYWNRNLDQLGEYLEKLQTGDNNNDR